MELYFFRLNILLKFKLLYLKIIPDIVLKILRVPYL
jgi:hypothetical protein